MNRCGTRSRVRRNKKTNPKRSWILSTGDLPADQDLIGALAAEVVSEAIIRAVANAESAYGYPSAAELGFLAY